MTRKVQPKPKTLEALSTDDAEHIRTWQRATGRKPGGEANAPHPYRAKLQHGIFANRIFGAEEMALFSAMIDIFREETAFNGSGDMVQLELFCIYCLKITRALMAKQWDAVERLDRMIRSHMMDLKLTKKMREGDGPAAGVPSPLDYAMQLVERARQRQQELADVAGLPGILRYLAQYAVECHYGRLDWMVLDWNTPAIGFYERLGAAHVTDWLTYRLSGDALHNLAESD